MTIKPKQAATLIIIDKKNKILMGRRHPRHKFMPSLFVFPGGKLERYDNYAQYVGKLKPHIENKIINGLKTRATKNKAKALALAAIRETFEETGLMLGKKIINKTQKNTQKNNTQKNTWTQFICHNIYPNLQALNLLARAITPPSQTKRYDTWFFVIEKQHIAFNNGIKNKLDNELQDIHWLTFNQTKKLELPKITRVILTELQHRLQHDRHFNGKNPVPCFQLKNNQFTRQNIY